MLIVRFAFPSSAIALITLAACTPTPVRAPASASPAATTTRAASSSSGNFPGLSAIDSATLRSDLYTMASDSMRGREAGTMDELRAAAWVAMRARDAGLEPAGDDGTYFQFWPMRHTYLDMSASDVLLDGSPLVLQGSPNAVVVTLTDTAVDLPLIYVGSDTGSALAARDVRGKAVAALLLPPARLPAPDVSLRSFRYTVAAIRERTEALTRAGASAIVLVSDAVAEPELRGYFGTSLRRGRYTIDVPGSGSIPAQPPVIWVSRSQLDRVRAAHQLVARLRMTDIVYPSVNIVARVPGTDPARRNEYVLFSSHLDHDGVRYAVDGDSIWNGADDNASTSVALLAIGRAFVAHPAPRSALFVWHGAEERGLLGSRWFAQRPTVPRSSITAVLNADMIGRNAPDTAGLLGVQPPNRNSAALARMVLAANDSVTHFAIDSSWDRPTHPERWYFRSDHLPYARAGIPAVEFSTLLHPDYHTPRDEPDLIDYAKLTRMTRWMYAAGWLVATAPERPALDSARASAP
ncbi:MAG TPA: M28 family peptidase [Gemmatimonadaceae bacterium]|nr:M28 family peptidase [Gemmatimonadaceae bacterium]